MFTRGQKVIYNGKIYDYGYESGTGKAIIYEEGECNMQDSYAVDFENIRPYNLKPCDFKPCIHPTHNPPTHLYIPPGQSVVHKCLGCGYEVLMFGNTITY